LHSNQEITPPSNSNHLRDTTSVDLLDNRSFATKLTSAVGGVIERGVELLGETRWLVSNVGAVGADVVALTVLYASLVLCSWLTYRMVERPCREWFRQVGNSREKLDRLAVPSISAAVTLPLPLAPDPLHVDPPGTTA
jgi:hypothetical protein